MESGASLCRGTDRGSRDKAGIKLVLGASLCRGTDRGSRDKAGIKLVSVAVMKNRKVRRGKKRRAREIIYEIREINRDR